MIILFSLLIVLRFLTFVRYRDLKVAEQHFSTRTVGQLVRNNDLWVEIVLMLAVWTEIILFFEMGSLFPPWVSLILLPFLIGSRFRALQEIGHTALHFGFGSRRKLQWQVADWLGNFWTFKPNSKIRHHGHCVEHHPHVNTVVDPNIQRMFRVGFVPGLSINAFRKYLIFPLTMKGLTETFRLYFSGLGEGAEPFIRFCLFCSLNCILAFKFGLWAPITWGLALVFVYPLYSWWSLLAEHRWFAENRLESGYTAHCSEVTPRTFYSGLSGLLVRYFISPCTDSLHLAHHLYPRIHWRYLAVADRLLENDKAGYAKHTMLSFFGTGPLSVIGNLRQRMTESGRYNEKGI